MQTLQQTTLRQAQGNTRQQIIKLLGWTELEYSSFIYETGLQYLELYIPTDRAGIDALSRSKIFWAWWRNHWAIRDRNYLEIHQQFSPVNYELLYQQEHSAETLTTSIFPNAVVLEDSYSNMIHHFNKSVI